MTLDKEQIKTLKPGQTLTLTFGTPYEWSAAQRRLYRWRDEDPSLIITSSLKAMTLTITKKPIER